MPPPPRPAPPKPSLAMGLAGAASGEVSVERAWRIYQAMQAAREG